MEQRDIKNTLEIATNIAVLLVALAVLSTLAITVFLRRPAPEFRAGLEKGKAFGEVSKVDYGSSEQTLLIALNTNCSYCQESLPFYQKLLEAQYTAKKGLRIIGLFPNNARDVTNYLKQNQLSLETVAEVDLGSLGLSGTPTMVLVNRSGEVKDFWVGKLSNTEVERFFQFLKSGK